MIPPTNEGKTLGYPRVDDEYCYIRVYVSVLFTRSHTDEPRSYQTILYSHLCYIKQSTYIRSTRRAYTPSQCIHPHIITHKAYDSHPDIRSANSKNSEIITPQRHTQIQEIPSPPSGHFFATSNHACEAQEGFCSTMMI